LFQRPFKLPAPLQASQNAQANVKGRQGVAPITHHGQGYAHHWQKPQAHADINGALREKQKGQPARE